MAWRIVKQPNGLLARFSDIIDDFTDMNMTEAEALELCRAYGMSEEDAKRKVLAGVQDWKPWTVGVPGIGMERWNDSLTRIENAHGEKVASERAGQGAVADDLAE